MALGDRFLKKVTGKSSAPAASDPAQIPSDSQLHSIVGALPFPEPSSASSGDHYSQQNHLLHQQQYHHHQQQYQQQQQHQHQRSHAHNSRPPSSSSMKALSFPSATAPTSVAGSSSSAGSAVSKSASPPILMKGYLLVKKGLLKGYEKRFYFLTPRGPELFCFRDEMQFDEWMASGAPLRKHLTMEKSSSKDRDPMLVCSVLRADRAGDSGAFDRAIAVISGDDTKCTSTKFLAPTHEVCEDWIVAFHRVQTARRTANPTAATTTASSASSGGMENSTPMSGRTASVADSYEAHQHHNRSALAAKVSTPLSSRSSRHSDTAASPSQHSVNAYTPHHQHHQSHSTASVVSGSTTASTAPASGNVLLFVPASGSAISISDSKLQQAKKEMEELVAKGAKPPMRGGLDNIKGTKWRYGPPEYVLSDLEYVRGKTRDDESTPLESYAEMCCQTFLMEATHKAQYNEWTSVRQDYFYIRVNDGEKIPGYAIQENDLFGLLYLNDYEVDMDLRDGEERKDPRAILAEAFTQGFPMEVLDVYTQPPQCHFSWRHWGRFTGRYRGVRGNGELIEIRGFGHMQIDSGRLLSLQLFFKQRDLFDQLNKATASGVATNRTARFNTASSAKDAGVDIAPKSTGTKSPPVSATPVPQTQTPQQRPIRSDKLGTDGHLGDFTDLNISSQQTQPQPLTRSTTAPAARSHSTESSGAAHSGRSATGSHQQVNRTQIYQKFMPQAPGA